MKRTIKNFTPLLLLILLTGCGGSGDASESTPSVALDIAPDSSTMEFQFETEEVNSEVVEVVVAPTEVISEVVDIADFTVQSNVDVVESEDVISEPDTLNTQDVLADPDADFKTFQDVNFIATNDSDLNVTLYIYDDLQETIARRYIASNSSTEVAIQVPTTQQTLAMHWHYRELVKEDEVALKDISAFSFTGFEG